MNVLQEDRWVSACLRQGCIPGWRQGDSGITEVITCCSQHAHSSPGHLLPPAHALFTWSRAAPSTCTLHLFLWFFQMSLLLSFTLGSQHAALHPWQRSWGRRLDIRKGGIEPRECPQIFSSIYPQKTRVCLLYCFVLSPLTLLGAVPHHHLSLSVKELTYSSN